MEFAVARVSVHQEHNGQLHTLPVVTYDQLASEERTRQVVAALGAGLAAAGNTYSASQAGYGSARADIYSRSSTPYGTYRTVGTATVNYYDPTAATLARANASAQNEAMIANVIETGRANMDHLERSVIKDHSVLPGEWYGGQLHFAAPVNTQGPKAYTISIGVGSDQHEIEVFQEPRG
jgi:hypothetical protein